MSAEKLKVVKTYITDNLLKGFIEPSDDNLRNDKTLRDKLL
ncbi:hypothetical protein VTL71DRAFT_4325 [Oculimacula yallundae]|uniref:Uncharacterized protein n=1 Tax=Oculimacula yallundae TaxID=86028 RepID=A0ABR4C5G0_9HELO